MIGIVVALTWAALALVSAVLAAHRASSAADLSALAAAGALQWGESPEIACAAARRIATANGADLVSCQTEPDDAVRVATSVVASVHGLGAATAVARAGPGEVGAERGST